MPYKDNVLSFYGTDAFQAFMKARTSEQKAAVTKLHFALCVLNVNKMERFWNDNITAANVLHLKGLKSLYIDLDIGVTSLKELAVLVRNGLLPLFYHKGLLRFCLANASSTNKDLLGARSDGLKHCTVKITHSGLDDKRLSPVIFDPDYGWWCRDPARVEWMAATRRRTEAVKLQARLLTQEANQVLTPNEKSSVEDLRRELLTYDNH